MSELLWDVRTILASTTLELATQDDGSNSNSRKFTNKGLSAVDIGNYLTSLSENNSGVFPGPAKIIHFQPEQFDRSWQDLPSQIGSGISYSVERCALKRRTEDASSSMVAFKRLHLFSQDSGTQMSTAAIQQSFATVLKELRILTHLPLDCHPNIVSLLEYSSKYPQMTADNNDTHQVPDISLVMEFAAHGTLQDFLQNRGAQGDQTNLMAKIQLMHDIASGLEALHECRIAHGDVKLENTLVFKGSNRPFIAKLSDFGHTLVDLQKDEGEEQRYLGSQLMNAPELRSRNFGSASESAVPPNAEAFCTCDIYSLGLLVWEVILDGNRFFKSMVVDSEERDQLLLLLNNLPKDDLLFRALASLRSRHQTGDHILLRIITNLLQSTLRDDPGVRKPIGEIVDIFRQQRDFNDPAQVK